MSYHLSKSFVDLIDKLPAKVFAQVLRTIEDCETQMTKEGKNEFNILIGFQGKIKEDNTRDLYNLNLLLTINEITDNELSVEILGEEMTTIKENKDLFKKDNQSITKMNKRNCLACGQGFNPQRWDSFYCDKRCRNHKYRTDYYKRHEVFFDINKKLSGNRRILKTFFNAEGQRFGVNFLASKGFDFLAITGYYNHGIVGTVFKIYEYEYFFAGKTIEIRMSQAQKSLAHHS